MANSSRKPIQVLLIDDHPMMLQGLSARIDSEGGTMKVVERAGNPDEAFRFAKEHKPEVIVLDLDLGRDRNGNKISGIDLISDLIKESGANVLILTGNDDVAVQAEAIKRGAKGVVLKDAPPEVVIQAIKKVSDGARWHSDHVLEYLMSSQRNGDGNEDLDHQNIASLTPMQLRVIAVVASNVTSTNKQIAKQLKMSEHTLKNHISEINSKLNTKNKMGLYMFAKKHNLDKMNP